MAAFKLISKLLKFRDFLCAGLAFRRGNRLDVLVKPYKNGCRCPACGRRGKIVRQRSEPRYWRDIPVGAWSIWLMYWPREICCDIHGRVTERLPWAEAGSRVSHRFEYLMLRYCQIMPQKAAAQLLRLPASTLSDLLHRTIGRLREGHRIRGLKTIGVDEISYHKGHKYATLVYDLERSCVVWIGQGKGREAIDRFFDEVPPSTTMPVCGASKPSGKAKSRFSNTNSWSSATTASASSGARSCAPASVAPAA